MQAESKLVQLEELEVPETSSGNSLESTTRIAATGRSARKDWKRRPKDRSQSARSALQLGFLLLNLYVGLTFFLWVRYFESGGRTLRVERPPGVEGWLPIASLMNLKAFLLSGDFPTVHPAGMWLLVAFLLIALLFRKAFCSWLCPVGTLSEFLWQAGRKLFRRNFALPGFIDIPLRGLKYLLLGLFVYAVGSMSVAAIRGFLEGPYGIVADVKMLDFFRSISTISAVVIGFLVVASVLLQNFWCRYLCPYGALMGLFAWFGPAVIQRDSDLCIDCERCARTCPSRLKVDKLKAVRSPECLGCYQCVAVCPVDKALEMKLAGRWILSPTAMAAGVLAVFLGFVVTAQLTGNWTTDLPDAVFFELVPKAGQFSHP